MPYIGNPAVVGDSTNTFKLLDDIASFTLTFDATDSTVVSISGDTWLATCVGSRIRNSRSFLVIVCLLDVIM